MTYVVIPCCIERVITIESHDEVFSVLNKTWAKYSPGDFGGGLVVFVASRMGIMPAISARSRSTEDCPAAIARIGMGVMIASSLASSASQRIVLGALYLHSVEQRSVATSIGLMMAFVRA